MERTAKSEKHEKNIKQSKRIGIETNAIQTPQEGMRVLGACVRLQERAQQMP
jgi:hypothetical protein